MAKTESTAVNQLISLVQTATPLKADPTEDLMFKAPDKATRKAASRMTATIPPIRAEVPPLPRQRAPQGTQRGVPIINERAPVRMSTAANPVTMPEIQPWASAEGTGESDVVTDVRTEALARPAVDPRATRPSLPPPLGSRSPLPAATQPAHGDSPRLAGPPPLGTRSPLPPAHGDSPRLAGPPPLPRAMRTEQPAVSPVAAPFEKLPAPTPEMNAYPSAAPYMHVAADMTSHQPWFDEQAPAVQPVEEIEIDFGTDRVRAKATDWRTLIPKLIAPTIGLIIVGMLVGGYLAFDGQGDKGDKGDKNVTAPAASLTDPVVRAPAEPKQEIKPEPKPEPVLAAKAAETPPNLAPHATAPKIAQDVKPAVVAPVAGRQALVDVRLDSTPSGATVTLIDRGKQTFIGTTPISTALDPSRQYDIVFSHASKPTQIEHIDPATTKRLEVVLGKSKKDAPKLEVKKAPKETRKAEAPKQLEVKKTEAPKPVVPKTEAPNKLETTEAPKTEAPKAVVDPFAAAPKGEGVLMVSSKPPCEILVDGVATGLTTPQRAIKLTAGTHKITLVNTAEKIKKTVTVTVSADQPTKVIENFMK